MHDISVRNNRSEVVDLVLEDQVPLTKNESIKITINETSGADYNSEIGMLTWRMNLKNGETKKFRVAYTVKFPKDQNVSGLE